jgi:VanZ family protein
MISTLLAEYPWVARIGIVAVLISAPFVARWLCPRRRMAWAVVAVSATAITVLTLLPDGTRTVAGCELRFSPTALLGVEPLANIVLFLPLTLTLTVLTGRPAPAFLAGLSLSLVIELMQWAVPAIGRSCTSTDWVANSLGAALGAALAALGLWRARRPSSRRQSI